MRPQTIVKLANITRRYSHYKNPVAYRVARTVLRWVYPVQPPERSLKIVTEYDRGLIHIDTRYAAERDIMFFGGVEYSISGLIRRWVKPGDVCLDIGANIGALTLIMAFTSGPSGRVLAFEPHPYILKRLKMNVAINGLDTIRIIPAAISKRAGKETLYTTSENHWHQGGSSLSPSDSLDQQHTIETITGNTVEQLLDGKICRLLKIDVEGHDCIVLKELYGIIETSRPIHKCLGFFRFHLLITICVYALTKSLYSYN